MANYIVTGEQLTGIADAIRAKSGESGQLVFPGGFVSELEDMISLKDIQYSTSGTSVQVDAPVGLSAGQSYSYYATATISSGRVIRPKSGVDATKFFNLKLYSSVPYINPQTGTSAGVQHEVSIAGTGTTNVQVCVKYTNNNDFSVRTQTGTSMRSSVSLSIPYIS